MMKQWRRMIAGALAVIMFAVCFAGCTPLDDTDPTKDTTQTTTRPGETEPSVTDTIGNMIEPTGNTILPGEAEQLRLPGYDPGWVNRFAGEYGPFAAVENAEELDAVVVALGRMGKDVTMPESYNEAFFQQYRLVLIPMQSGSGSVSYDVSVGFDGELITVILNANMPEVGTADMADWLVLVALDRNLYPDDAETVLQANPATPAGPDMDSVDK